MALLGVNHQRVFETSRDDAVATMRRIVRDKGRARACETVEALYGPKGSAIPGAWTPAAKR
jgi:hypothetical protein